MHLQKKSPSETLKKSPIHSMYDLMGRRRRMRLERRAGGNTGGWSDADESNEMKGEQVAQEARHLFRATTAAAVVARSGRGLLPRVILLRSRLTHGQNQMLTTR
jgi:hypothetical protein